MISSASTYDIEFLKSIKQTHLVMHHIRVPRVCKCTPSTKPMKDTSNQTQYSIPKKPKGL